MAFAGERNRKGDKGEDGKDGKTPNITIGQVEDGDVASVSLSGDAENPVLNFTLPRGREGKRGKPGKDGESGKSGVVQVNTVMAEPDSDQIIHAIIFG